MLNMRRFGLLALFALTGTGVLLHAQGSSLAARVRALSGQIIRLHGLVQAAAPAQAAALRGQAGPLIEERADAFYLLIDESPTEALSLAFSPDLLADLAVSFPQSASRFESHGEWQGLIEYSISTDPTMTVVRSTRRMRSGQQQLNIQFAGPEPAGLKSGDLLSVRGVRGGNRVAAAGGTILGSSVAASCGTVGAQSVAAILVNFQNYKLPSGVDTELVKGILFGNAFTIKTNTPDWSVDDFWQQGSDGQTSLPFANGTVNGPYTLAKDYNTVSGAPGCDSDGVRFDAIAAADPDINFQNYSRIVIVMPNNYNSVDGSGCGWAGLGSLGCWGNSSPGDGSFTASLAWQRADQMANRSNGVRLTTHEMGHNLTLHHASSRDFPGPPREPLGPLGVTGTLSEYGDLFSTMGSWNFGHYSAQHAAELLSWFSSSNYQVVETSGSYSVQAYETRPAGKKALKIRRGTGNNAWLWLEHRQNQGIYDSQLNSQAWSGALMHYEDSATGTHTHLPDYTSGTTSFSDPALAVGQSWSDPYSNLSISVDSAVSGTLNVTVTYGTVPCNQANPTVTLSPLNSSTPEGTGVNYTVSVKNNDSSGCSSGTLTLTSTEPSGTGWGSSFSPTSLTIAPGATSNATLTKTPPSGSAGGPYLVNAIATNGTFSGPGTANITVIMPPPPLTTTVDVPNTTYAARSTVPITATVKSGTNPAAGATVKFSLVRSGKTTTQTMTTGADGKATWNYKANNKGSYSVSETATLGSQTALSNTDTFTVN